MVSWKPVLSDGPTISDRVYTKRRWSEAGDQNEQGMEKSRSKEGKEIKGAETNLFREEASRNYRIISNNKWYPKFQITKQ